MEREATLEIQRQGFIAPSTLKTVRVKPSKPTAKFPIKEIVEPEFYHLYIRGQSVAAITLLVEPSEEVRVTIDLKNPNGYIVENSEGSLRVQQLTTQMRTTNRALDSLNQAIINQPDLLQKQALTLEKQAVLDSQRAFSTRFIWENPRSRASVMALYQRYGNRGFVFDRLDDHLLFRVVGSALQAMYPESEYTKGILRDIKNQVQVINAHSIDQIISQAEPTLPEIALPNPSGDTIRLSSLRGNVILLDFWASWHPGTLMDSRELLDIYKRFKGKGFEVYQVSLDFDREKWVNAIQRAQLPWVNVSELTPDWSRAAASYNVTSLPANYLINKDYDIVGKNIYGKDLEKKLEELLN